MSRYLLRPGVELSVEARRVRLVSRYPARVVELSPHVIPLVRSWRRGEPLDFSEAAVCGLTEERVRGLTAYLLQRDFLVPIPNSHPSAAEPRPTVSVVVVVRERPRQLARCLRSLCALDWPADRLEIIVVDDHSRDRTPAVADGFARAHRRHLEGPRVQVLRSASHGGIAAARNAGVRAAGGSLVAFTDSDCTVHPGWLRAAVSRVESPVGAVGGSVRGLETRTRIQRYEDAYSPLHMGDVSRPAGAGTSVPYLPTCNFVARMEAVVSAGYFDAELQVGEDVDMCRRLEKAEWQLTYEPAAIVFHDHRDRLLSMLRRRFDYGRSEALLRSRWGETSIPARTRVSRTVVLALLFGLGLSTGGIFAVALAGVVILSLVLGVAAQMVKWLLARRQLPLEVVVCAKLRGLAARGWAFGTWFFRYWSVPFLVLAILWPKILIWMALLLALTGGVEWVRRRPRLDPATATILHFADLAVYQLGVRTGQVAVVVRWLNRSRARLVRLLPR